MAPRIPAPLEPIGKRIARLRAERGLTQQALASRLAVSRVAISHIEMDLTIPGERTIALLAGIFKVDPDRLVENTTYPPAKAERLPETVCSFTGLELELALLDNDLEWLKRLEAAPDWECYAAEVRLKWKARLVTFWQSDRENAQREQAQAGLRRLEQYCIGRLRGS